MISLTFLVALSFKISGSIKYDSTYSLLSKLFSDCFSKQKHSNLLKYFPTEGGLTLKVETIFNFSLL